MTKTQNNTQAMTKNENNDARDLDLGDDLVITKTTRRASGAGTWVSGTIHGHRFDALVFPEHAEVPEYERHNIAFQPVESIRYRVEPIRNAFF